jgi:ketosteroid isomerase-like protein
MSLIAHLMNYAIAFEAAYATDDWSKIDPSFTDDAVYQPLGAFGGAIEGRDAVKSAFKMMVNAFDRRFASRAVEVIEGPTERDGSVWFRWAATYTLPDAPALRMIGEETLVFEGGRIRRMEDRMSEEETQKVQAYLATHGAKLKPAA